MKYLFWSLNSFILDSSHTSSQDAKHLTENSQRLVQAEPFAILNICLVCYTLKSTYSNGTCINSWCYATACCGLAQLSLHNNHLRKLKPMQTALHLLISRCITQYNATVSEIALELSKLQKCKNSHTTEHQSCRTVVHEGLAQGPYTETTFGSLKPILFALQTER